MSGEHMPSWELYETFLQVMRGGSLSAASRAMGAAQPTVRRRIAALEASLGHPLFTRSSNGLVPTEVATRILPFAEAMELTARSLTRAASADEDALAGTVRVSASELMGAEVLPGVLEPLQRACPGLQIELVLSDTVADVGRREADIAVRMTPPKGASLVARRLGRLGFGFFASRAYLERQPAPGTLAALRHHDLIGQDTNPQLLSGLAALGLELTPRDFRLRTDHSLAYLASIRAGLGIGVTQVAVAGSLVRVLPELELPVDLWLVVHEDLRHVGRIRAVMDHLAQGLQAYVG